MKQGSRRDGPLLCAFSFALLVAGMLLSRSKPWMFLGAALTLVSLPLLGVGIYRTVRFFRR